MKKNLSEKNKSIKKNRKKKKNKNKKIVADVNNETNKLLNDKFCEISKWVKSVKPEDDKESEKIINNMNINVNNFKSNHENTCNYIFEVPEDEYEGELSSNCSTLNRFLI